MGPVSNVVRIPIGDGEEGAPVPKEEAAPPPRVDLAEQAAKAAVGLAALAVESSVAILRRISGLPGQDDERAEPVGLGLLAGAGLGFIMEAGRAAAAAADVARRTVVPPAAFVAGTFLDAPRRAGQDRAAEWNEAWLAERPDAQAVAQAVLTETIQRAVNAVLDQIDLTQVVLDRVDLDRVIASVDLDKAVERVDLNEVIDHVDIERIIAKLDLAKLSLEVIDQIDLPEIIRASTGTVASESVRVVRMQTIGADRAIAKVVDRLLRRTQGEQPDEPPAAPEADGES
jgi:hypothetical protein